MKRILLKLFVSIYLFLNFSSTQWQWKNPLPEGNNFGEINVRVLIVFIDINIF
jgi:hypothetical protein